MAPNFLALVTTLQNEVEVNEIIKEPSGSLIISLTFWTLWAGGSLLFLSDDCFNYNLVWKHRPLALSYT